MASNYPFVQPDAAKVTGTFAKAFDLFSQCHNGYNSSHHMTDRDIDKLGKNNTIRPHQVDFLFHGSTGPKQLNFQKKKKLF